MSEISGPTEALDQPAAEPLGARRVVRAAVRGVGAPLRGFFNQHFEMVKTDLRGSAAEVQQRLAEITNFVTETNLHNAKIIAGLRSEVREMADQVARLQETNDLLREAVTALTPVLGADARNPVDAVCRDEQPADDSSDPAA